jgi:hypothetical protein
LFHLRNLKDQSTRARIDQEIQLRRAEKTVAAEKLVVDLDVEEMGCPAIGEIRRQRPFPKRSILVIGDHRLNGLIGRTSQLPQMDAGRNLDEQVSGDRVAFVRTGQCGNHQRRGTCLGIAMKRATIEDDEALNDASGVDQSAIAFQELFGGERLIPGIEQLSNPAGQSNDRQTTDKLADEPLPGGNMQLLVISPEGRSS